MAKNMFTEGFTVEEEHLKQPWLGGRNGIYFRCMMCGHRFEVGDHCKWYLVKATDTHLEDGTQVSAPNVMVCAECESDCTMMGRSVVEVWVGICTHVYDEHWYFVRPHDMMRRSDTDPWPDMRRERE